MSRKQGGSGPPPGGGHSRGGKRKLVVDSSLSMHSEDEVSGPAQKPRMEDDLLGKFLQVSSFTPGRHHVFGFMSFSRLCNV